MTVWTRGRISRPEGTGPVFPVRPTRREALLEALVFLFLIVPSMVLSFFLGRREAQVSFFLLAVATILRDLSLVGLVLFFVWRNGEPVRRLGWRHDGLDRELLLGFVLHGGAGPVDRGCGSLRDEARGPMTLI